MQHIERGFSFDTLLRLEANSGVSIALLASVIGTGNWLGADESERLLRVSTLFEKCVELFEAYVTSAVNWLTPPKRALNNHQNILYARTELGAREVENLMGRLEHGSLF